jgi:hypothetical protein
MNIKEVIGPLMVYSTIYDVDLPTRIIQDMEEEQLHLDPEKIYDVEVIFDTRVFELDEFYAFNLTNPGPTPRGRKEPSEGEKKREKMYSILSEQLDNVTKALKDTRISIRNATIVGEEHIMTFFVDVYFFLLEPEPEVKGKRKPPEGHCNFIIPSRKSFHENLAKAFKLLEEAQNRRLKEDEKQKQIEQHSPNWFLAEELFSEIAHFIYSSDYDNAMAHKERLYSTAFLVSGWPLQIKSRAKAKSGTPIGKDSKLDCPEYLIYIQDTNGEWSIDKTENLKTAQETIVKHGYNLKRSERIVVLHNLKAVPYTLFKQTDEGLVEVTPEEARGEKKLYLSWNK